MKRGSCGFAVGPLVYREGNDRAEADGTAAGHKALAFWSNHQPLARIDADDLSVSRTATPGSTISIYYRCLPDTVDPRGPKGSERRRRPPLASLAPHQPPPGSARIVIHPLDDVQALYLP